MAKRNFRMMTICWIAGPILKKKQEAVWEVRSLRLMKLLRREFWRLSSGLTGRIPVKVATRLLVIWDVSFPEL